MITQASQMEFSSDSVKLLADMSNASGVSGAEQPVRAIIREALKDTDVEIREDALGNLIVHRAAADGSGKKVMLAAHMDETGLMITGDDGDGLYAFSMVGETDIRQLPGKPVLVGKKRAPGVIGARAIHLTTAEQRKQSIPLSTLRIDLGPKGKAELGDRVIFATEFRQEGTGLFGKALDNRIGVAVLIEYLKQAPKTLDLFAVFTSQKELGNRGEMTAAFNLEPDFVILIDAAEAADFPAPQAGQENTRYGCRLGHGPVVFPVRRKVISDPVLFELFLQTAEKENIPYQVGQANMAETRVEAAGAINKVKAGMRSLTLSTPVRYAHTAINRAHLGDVENTLRLLKAGLAGLSGL